MPAECPGVYPIAHNLLRLRTSAKPLLGTWAAEAVAIWEFAAAVHAVPADHPSRGCERLTARRRGSRYVAPLRGYYRTHPVWAALWYRHWQDAEGEGEGREHPELYRRLQAHYLAAHLRILWRGEFVLPARMESAGRAVRFLHHPTFDHVVAWFERRAEGPIALFKALVSAKEYLQREDETSLSYGLGCLAEMIRVAHALGYPSVFHDRQGESTPRSHSSGYGRWEVDRLWPDHAYYWYFVARDGYGQLAGREGMIEVIEPPEGPREGILDAGGAPGEYQNPGGGAWIDVDMLVDDADPGELPPLGSLYAAARARARRMRMQVQRLRVDAARIRVAEIAELVGTLSEDYQRFARLQPRTQQAQQHRDETLRMLRVAAVAVVTGARPAELNRRHRFPIIERAKDLPTDYELGLNPEHGMWIRPYDEPERQPMRVDRGSARVETWPRVVYPDVWSVAAHTTDADRPEQWTTHRTSTLRSRWDEFLERHAFEYVRPKWLRYDALAGILPSWWRGREEGDHLTGRLLFRDSDPLASVHHYYTAYDREALADRYHSVLADLAERIEILDADQVAGPQLFARRRIAWSAPKSWVGDDRVLRVEAMQRLVAVLRESLTAHGHMDAITQHNRMALYTGVGLALVTGFRAVRTPIVDLTEIDHDTRTLCLQEKDRWDGGGARLVVLPEPVYEQVHHYLRHLRRLWVRLPAATAASVHVPATKHRDASVYGSDGFDLALHRTLFLFQSDDSGQSMPVEFAGAAMQAELNALLPDSWPTPNAGRHALRSWLTEQGAAVTVINAIMGHAHYGEEYWAPASAMDPVGMRREVLPYLEALTRVLGYQAVPA
ncbi:hypothetical protein [Arhodomonas sp. SL1]|uniref:hypothetical protein n=1 Tax=Arhodomonas sp. SL1 TaxID=3425691 RepID=UPI003F882391